MTNGDKKLLKLALRGLDDNNLDEKSFKAFSRDYTKYRSNEITFRELLNSITNPKGELKEAMQGYYANSVYTRSFKN